MGDFSTRIQQLSVQLVPFIMAVVFHEFAHGFMAKFWGDHTAKDQGRLTLNPIPHIDPIGTLLFPIMNMITGINLMFGWARPVPINPNRFRKYRQALFWVSLAGPGMNVLLATLSAIVYCFIELWLPKDFYLYDPLKSMTLVSVFLNYGLAIFNLIPLPPLDGSKIIEAFLPYKASQKYESLSQYSFFILLALLFTGALNVLSYPIQFLASVTLYLATLVFNVPLG